MIFDGSELSGPHNNSNTILKEDVPDLSLHKSGDEQSLQEAHMKFQRCKLKGVNLPCLGKHPREMANI